MADRGSGRSAGTRRWLAALAAASALLVACDDAPETAVAPPPPAVVVAPVVEREVTASSEFIGRVEAVDYVELRARVDGFIQERLFIEGQTVAAGDLLFIIDPAPYAAAVDAARAELAGAQASVTQTRAQVDRSKELKASGDISQAKLDQDVAADQQAAAAVAMAQARLRQAQIELDYTNIVAPFDGRIGVAEFSIGNLVGPSSGPLASITTIDPVEVAFTVSERDILEAKRRRIELGLDPLFDSSGHLETRFVPKVILPDGTLYQQPGAVDFVASGVDPLTGTVTVRASFPNPEVLLMPGQYVTVVLEGNEPLVRVVVPQTAVQQNQAGAFVLVVDGDDMVEMRPVVLGMADGTDHVVETGLAPGEMVIVDGLQKVRAGMPVDPVVLAPGG